jgi:hypothetical protein
MTSSSPDCGAQKLQNRFGGGLDKRTPLNSDCSDLITKPADQPRHPLKLALLRLWRAHPKVGGLHRAWRGGTHSRPTGNKLFTGQSRYA